MFFKYAEPLYRQGAFLSFASLHSLMTGSLSPSAGISIIPTHSCPFTSTVGISISGFFLYSGTSSFFSVSSRSGRAAVSDSIRTTISSDSAPARSDSLIL